MVNKHRRLKFHHKAYILLGGWQILFPFLVVGFISFQAENDIVEKKFYEESWFWLVILFSFIMGAFQMYKKYKMLFVLKNGILTWARLFSKIISDHGSSDSPKKYEYTFEFFDEDNTKHQHSFKSPKLKRLEDESEELIMYLKTNPKRAVVLDSLPWPMNKYVKKHWTLKPREDKNSFIKRY